MEGSKSTAETTVVSLTVPQADFSIKPGPQTMNGSRMPPSYSVPLCPRNGPADPAPGSGPLSLANENQGVGAQARLLADVIEQRRQLLVHRFDHPEVKLLLAAVPPQRLGREERRVDIVGPHIDVEGLARLLGLLG